MKKIILFLFLTLTYIVSNAQVEVFQQNYESLNVGDPGSDAGHQLEGGSSSIQIATSTGNTTKILKAVHGASNDMYVRTSNLTVEEGEVYEVSFDFAGTAAVHAVTMRYSNGDVAPFTVIHPDIPASSTNGTQSGANGRIQGVPLNTFTTTTAKFTVPAGYNRARVQVYQFGTANSFELDNFSVIRTFPPLSLQDLSKFNFASSPNPAKDYLNLSASKNIDKIEIYNLLGKQVIDSSLNVSKAQVSVSNLSTGLYVVKAYIEDSVGTYKFIKE